MDQECEVEVQRLLLMTPGAKLVILLLVVSTVVLLLVLAQLLRPKCPQGMEWNGDRCVHVAEILK